MMQARGDFAIFNEAAEQMMCRIHYKHLAEVWFRENTPLTYADVKKGWFEALSTRPVFAKEMGYCLKDSFIQDDDFIRNPDVHFVFLMRDPHSVIVSFYKKCGGIPYNFNELLGFKALDELLQKIKAEAAHPPVIVHSQELSEHPKTVVANFCKQVGIPFIESALAWPDLGDDFTGVIEWHETKKKTETHIWHGDAIHSTGFIPLKTYAADPSGNPTFEEIENPADRAACFEAYNFNKSYYERLLKSFSDTIDSQEIDRQNTSHSTVVL